MTWQQHIEIDAKILVGKPVVKGTRVSVEHIIELLANGWDITEITTNYPNITPEDIRACLAYASERVRSSGAQN